MDGNYFFCVYTGLAYTDLQNLSAGTSLISMLKDAIDDCKTKRINEAQYLNKVKDIMNAVLNSFLF